MGSQSTVKMSDGQTSKQSLHSSRFLQANRVTKESYRMHGDNKGCVPDCGRWWPGRVPRSPPRPASLLSPGSFPAATPNPLHLVSWRSGHFCTARKWKLDGSMETLHNQLEAQLLTVSLSSISIILRTLTSAPLGRPPGSFLRRRRSRSSPLAAGCTSNRCFQPFLQKRLKTSVNNHSYKILEILKTIVHKIGK